MKTCGVGVNTKNDFLKCLDFSLVYSVKHEARVINCKFLNSRISSGGLCRCLMLTQLVRVVRIVIRVVFSVWPVTAARIRWTLSPVQDSVCRSIHTMTRTTHSSVLATNFSRSTSGVEKPSCWVRRFGAAMWHRDNFDVGINNYTPDCHRGLKCASMIDFNK